VHSVLIDRNHVLTLAVNTSLLFTKEVTIAKLPAVQFVEALGSEQTCVAITKTYTSSRRICSVLFRSAASDLAGKTILEDICTRCMSERRSCSRLRKERMLGGRLRLACVELRGRTGFKSRPDYCISIVDSRRFQNLNTGSLSW
jgi:hypothetical protein